MTTAAIIMICLAAQAVDGDTIKCADGVRIRIAGVEANELSSPGCHLALCPKMPGREAKARMQALLGSQSVTYVTNGRSYGRVTGSVQLPDGRDLACETLRLGMTVRWDRYWPKRKECDR